MTATPTIVEVFADIGCPFTHVGLRRFVEVRARAGREDVNLLVRSWPLELVNGAPLDAHFIAEEVDDLRRQIAPDLFGGFREDTFPATSVPALALAAAAYRQGLDVGEQVSLELRDLVFEQGVDVAEGDVLAAVADRHGVVRALDHDAVLADLDEGKRRSVTGSPHFFTASGGFFCPALDIHRGTDGHLQIAFDPDGFDQFIAAALAPA